MTVREALGILEGWGFLEARRGSGTRAPAAAGAGPWRCCRRSSRQRPPGSPEAGALRALAVEALALRRSFARSLPAQLAGRLAAGSLKEARRLTERAFAERAVPARFVALDAAGAARGARDGGRSGRRLAVERSLAGAPRPSPCWLSGPAPVPADYVARQDSLWDALEAGDAVRAERLVGAHLARLDRGLLAAFEAGPAGREER